MDFQLQQLKYNVLYAGKAVLSPNWRTDNFDKPSLILPYSRVYLPISGEASYDFFGKHYVLRPGIMLFIPPFARTYACCDKYCEMYWANFNCHMSDSNVDVFSIEQPSFYLPANDFDFKVTLFEKLCDLFRDTGATQSTGLENYEAGSILNLIMLQFLESIFPNGTLNTDLELFFPLLKYITSHPEENYNLTSLAKKFHCHQTYLTNLFKDKFGVPLIQYINRQKLNYALRLLATTNTPINSISNKIGMTTPANFSRLFKKYFGVSPANFRKYPKQLSSSIQ